jgi:hypothetical protein
MEQLGQLILQVMELVSEREAMRAQQATAVQLEWSYF